MQRYVEQLVGDMRNAASKAPKVTLPDDRTNPEYLESLENSPAITMSKLFGLSKEIFPPSDKLSSENINQLAAEFHALWKAYSIEPIFPDKLPEKRQYELFVEQLKEKFQYWSGWTHTWEFCCYDPSKCPFGSEYCWCKDHIDEWEKDWEEFLKEKNHFDDEK